MSKDLVLVPCYVRPELLYHCLVNLSKADGILSQRVVVCEDNHIDGPPSPGNKEVAMAFPIVGDFHTIEPHAYWGNNWNTLKAYEWAAHQGGDLVYLVEEDVMVGEDFFNWHEVVMDELRPFCSIGVRHLDWPTSDDPREYMETHAFASLGCCFRANMLSWVLSHVPEGYYGNQIPSLDAAFPDSRFKGHSGAQDGFISRLMERHGLRSILPRRPRAYHAGWYGFNRGMSQQPDGNLSDRVIAVGESMRDPAFMAQQVADCQPCDLKAAPWDGELIEWKPTSTTSA